MKKRIIQLPRGYLSYSQKELWKNDRERYMGIYFDGREELRHSNNAMEYGKVVADALEKGKDTGDVLTDAAMLLLPKYDLADEELRVELRTKDGWIPLLGRLDTRDSKSWDFREYKTGKQPWTQSKAEKHPQMRFYAMLVYLASQKQLKEAYLDWIETESVDGVTKPTGRIQSFRVPFTLTDILKEMAETSRVAKEIEIAWASHVRDPKYDY
jgi:hypothetical protein